MIRRINLIGKRFGKLIVLKMLEELNKHGGSKCECLCDCGSYIIASSNHLKSGSTKSCGCLKNPNIIGQKFGRWTVIEKTLRKGKNNRSYYLCLCDCGVKKEVAASHLIGGKTKSCGCLHKEIITKDPISFVSKKINRWLVISYKGRNRHGAPLWECLCDCGNIKIISGNNLQNDKSKSCGCLANEDTKKRFTKYIIDGKTLKEISEINKIPYSSLQQIFLKLKNEKDVLNYIEYYKTNITQLEQKTADLLKLPKFDKKALNNSDYRPDFRPASNLFVNVDGLYWHSEEQKGKGYHFEMREAYEAENKRIMQFYEDEIYQKSVIVKSIVDNAWNKITNKIMARKCELREVASFDSELFFNSNHLMGNYASSKCIGLYYDNELVSALSYRIMQKKGYIEIARFGSKLNAVVIGGFSKLLSELEQITNEIGFNKIISYCDLRYATGKSYEINGFQRLHLTKGWCWSDGHTRFNRLKCKATPELTEKEHAKELGWWKIYDAGQAKYEKVL